MGFLVAQMVKNLYAMQETWARSLDWEDPLEKGDTIYSIKVEMLVFLLKKQIYSYISFLFMFSVSFKAILNFIYILVK